ncbi:MAG: putative glycoside hydrolase [Actinomycetota bacterium]|nr:putative glycoside hydrolase [Actinomycetota bacterium]
MPPRYPVRRRRLRVTRRGYVVFTTLGLLAVATPVSFVRSGLASATVDVASDEMDDGLLNAAEMERLEVAVRFSPKGDNRGATVTVDGREVKDRKASDAEALLVRPEKLADGDHRLTASVRRRFPFWAAKDTKRFRVDTVPPSLSASPPPGEVAMGSPFELTGRVEAGAGLTADAKPVPLDDGEFRLRYERPPPGPVHLVATDRAGNTATMDVPVDVAHPGGRAVHVTASAWAAPSLRDPVLALIDSGRIDTVQLDLKDESGVVGYESQVPLARVIGASKGIYDLRQAVTDLHGRKARVIGRIVAFRDPVLTDAAWKAGDRDQVTQTPSGGRYAKYGGFTNPANPVVRQYNIDLAVEAARAGVDDILYDYVRRPDGPVDQMRFAGLSGTPEDAIVSFLADSHARVRAEGAFQGASVYGIATTRPQQIAQDIPRLARHVDYVAPMLYPSHWNRGEYGVADPNREPAQIVARSLEDFSKAVEGSGATLMPWLQDFSMGVVYGPAQVRAQIDAAAAAGVESWILWDPTVSYTTAALEPRPR